MRRGIVQGSRIIQGSRVGNALNASTKRFSSSAPKEPNAEAIAYYRQNPPPNINYWSVAGPHNAPVSQRRVWTGVGIILGTSFVIFKMFGLTRDEDPITLTKEWKAESAKRYREENMQPIREHKIGAPVKIVEPSIDEE